MTRKLAALLIILFVISGSLITTSVYLVKRQTELACQIDYLKNGNQTQYQEILSQYLMRVNQTVSQVGFVLNCSGAYDYEAPFLQIYNATVFFKPNDTGVEVQNHNGTLVYVYGAWMIKLDDLCKQNKLALQGLTRVDNATCRAVFQTAYYYGDDIWKNEP
jgi:hypothetical protein